MSNSEIPTLTYFDGRGFGELSRLVLTAAGVKFNDERLSLQPGKTPPFGEDWLKLKPSTPYGHLPLLTYQGHTIAESAAIVRFLARQYKLEGDSEIDHALIDGAFEHVSDIRKQLFAAKSEASKSGDATKVEEFLTNKFPELIAAFNKNITGSPFFNGTRLSYADIAIYYVLWVLNTDHPEHAKKALAANPKIQAIYTAVETEPKIAAYLAQRKVTAF